MEMFSYIIHNPNNFPINNTDFYTIPFGHRCTSAIACKHASIRKMSLPFDWLVPLFPKKIQDILENNFEDFIPDVYNGNFRNKYDITLCHFNPDINAGIEEYKRRIDRFNNIINKPTKLYFVYINEDYLYDNNYRQDKFNANIFNEMLELEIYLKKQYVDIDYNILYFNFKQHDIPADSNIINIVLTTTNVYDISHWSYFNPFRSYCSLILSELFNTAYDPSHPFSDPNIFK